MIPSAAPVSEDTDESWVVWYGEGRRELRGWPEIRIDGQARARSGEGPGLRIFGPAVQRHAGTASSASGTVVFFGRLWNRRELATEIGVREDAAEDADLVLQGYRRWGSGLLRRLRGVFALSIFDRERRLLICARDPMGIWPLFYAAADGALVFSTSIDSLLRFPGVPTDVCRASLAIVLCNLSQQKDDTFYAGIRRLHGGHALFCCDGSQRITRYWDPVPGKLPKVGEGEERVREFGALVEQAVARCLQHGRAGIFLSGGIDSVTVAATATDVCRRRDLPLPKAFSLIYPDMQANEEPIQRGVATALGLDQFIVDVEEIVGPEGFLRPAMEVSRRSAAPTLTIWLPAYHRLARVARERGCECILTGGGGDEWLLNSPFLVADRLRSFEFGSVMQMWLSLRNAFHTPPFRLTRVLLWAYGLRPLFGSMVAEVLDRMAPRLLDAKRDFFLEIPDWIAPDPRLREEIRAHLEPTLLPSRTGGFYLREVRRFLDHFLVATEMELQFDYERFAGLLVLQPFFDPDLLSMLCQIAPEFLSEAGRSKSPARRMVAERFPHLGFAVQKKVHGTNYFRTLMMREGHDGWQSVQGAPALARCGLVDPRKLSLTVQDIFRKNDSEGLFQLWCILSAESWLRPRI